MIPILQVKICDKSGYPDKQQKTVYFTVEVKNRHKRAAA